MSYIYKHYIFYSQSDPSKEPIDKVLAYDYDGALEYFSERKKMSKKMFLDIYTIIENGSK
jgi:hypothetical protein